MNDKLKKILSTSALSVALISWWTTANGLYMYIFDYFWQAYIMSSALQGVLFALSIKGFDLFIQFKQKYKKIALIIIWLSLLAVSSTFSYVYVSRTVYSDKMLEYDAKRILNAYCLKENYNLSSEIEILLNGNDGIKESMNNYIQLLANTENGVEIDRNSEERMNILINKLEDNVNDFEYFPDITLLLSYINNILDGKYSENDIVTLNAEIQNVLDYIEDNETANYNSINVMKEDADNYQKRLRDFKNTTNTNYIELKSKLEHVQKEIESLEKEKRELNEQKTYIKQMETIIISIEGSLENDLYQNVIELYNEMNMEQINTENLLKCSGKIYDIMLKNNVNAADKRMSGYNKFKNDVTKYEQLITAQQLIGNEIDALYNQTENADNDNSEYITNSEGQSDIAETADEWRNYWHKRLNSLKSCVQIMSKCGLKSDEANNLIDNINDNERLYLSDLNDLERSFALLFGRNPMHPYKTILAISFVFSFWIDMFAVLISFMIYIVRNKAAEN